MTSLNDLQYTSGAIELLELARIINEEERLRAIDGWLKRRVKDYHVDFRVTREAKAYCEQKGDWSNFLEHEKRRAAYKIGEELLKHKIIMCTHLSPPEDEFSVAGSDFRWWEVEERYRVDCYAYFGLY